MAAPSTSEERALRAALKMCGLNLRHLPALEQFRRSGGITAMQRIADLPPPLTLTELRRDRERRAKAETQSRRLQHAEEQRSQRLRVKEEAQARKLQRAESFTELYVDGMTLKQVGSIYGVSKERVRQVIAEHATACGRDIGEAQKKRKEQKEQAQNT